MWLGRWPSCSRHAYLSNYLDLELQASFICMACFARLMIDHDFLFCRQHVLWCLYRLRLEGEMRPSPVMLFCCTLFARPQGSVESGLIVPSLEGRMRYVPTKYNLEVQRASTGKSAQPTSPGKRLAGTKQRRLAESREAGTPQAARQGRVEGDEIGVREKRRRACISMQSDSQTLTTSATRAWNPDAPKWALCSGCCASYLT